jgi:DNA-binding FrmR family transcriptional regulator
MLPRVKEDALARIKRISGQTNGIARMIEEDRYCVEILHQIAAARSALDQLGVQLLSGHVESCILSGDQTERGPLLDEVRTCLSGFLK